MSRKRQKKKKAEETTVTSDDFVATMDAMLGKLFYALIVQDEDPSHAADLMEKVGIAIKEMQKSKDEIQAQLADATRINQELRRINQELCGRIAELRAMSQEGENS